MEKKSNIQFYLLPSILLAVSVVLLLLLFPTIKKSIFEIKESIFQAEIYRLANAPPDISQISDSLAKNEGEIISAAEMEKATDPDGDTLTYTYSNWLTSLPYTIGYSDQGTHTLHVEVSDGKDPRGKDIVITVNDVDITPPTGSITINDGAEHTNSTNVILTLSAQDDAGAVDQMSFSNDNINWSALESYTTAKSWTLSSGDGQKTVYAKFKDVVGNWSEPATDAIILDTARPTTPIVTELGSATIDIDVNQIVGQLNDDIFGGGIPGRVNAFFNSDYLQELKKMGVKLIRTGDDPYIIPFTRAIGPLTSRIVIKQDAVKDVDKYPAGPDEWMKVAKAAGSELSVIVPYNDGSDIYKNQAKNLVEYMNVAVTPTIEEEALTEGWNINSWSAFDIAPAGYFAWLRKQYNPAAGNEPIKKVKYWEIGNEEYGGWYGGNTVSSDYYVKKAIEFAATMKTINLDIKVGAVISAGWDESKWDQYIAGTQIWEEVISDAVINNGLDSIFQDKKPAIDFLIPHYYGSSVGGGGIKQTYLLFNPRTINYKLLNGSSAPIDKIPVAYVNAINLNPGNYTFSIEGFGQQAPDNLIGAQGIFYDGEYLYIADTYNHRIVKSKFDGSGWISYGSYGSGVGQFRFPRDVFYDSSTGYIYVSDFDNHRIVKTKFDGSGWVALGTYGSGIGQFKRPSGINYDSLSGYIYVADADNHRIVKTKIDGTEWTTLGTYGSGIGQFRYPSDLFFDSSTEFIYIIDTYNHRIVKTKIDGAGWTTYGREGVGIGQFEFAQGIAYDSASEDIYITDTNNKRIVKTKIDGAGWTTYGKNGTGIGEFSFSRGIFYDGLNGDIYVSDSDNRRIIKTKIDGSSWTIAGKGPAAYPKLSLRIIDDGGEGNASMEDPLTINSPAEVKDAGTVEVDGSEIGTFKFTTDGKQASPATTVKIEKDQGYRAELLFYNHVWIPDSYQGIGNAKISKTLSKVSDYLAQSFKAIDYKFNYLSITLARSEVVYPADAKIIAEVYPDTGNNTPDMSGEPYVRCESYDWEKIDNFPIGSIGNPYVCSSSKIFQTQDLEIGKQYWIVFYLNKNLISGEVSSFGNLKDDYPDGKLLTKTAYGPWLNDSVLDIQFYAQSERSRVAFVKNIKMIDEGGNSQIILLSEKEWYESVVLSGDFPKTHISRLKNYFQTANQNLKNLHPEWLNLADYNPEIIVTEFSYSDGLGGEYQTFRRFYPAIFGANTYINFLNNQLSGAVLWSVSPWSMVYRYQDNWPIFYLNPPNTVEDIHLYTPRYYMFRLLNENRGQDIVKTSINSPNFAYSINFGALMLPNDAGGSGASNDQHKYYWSHSPSLIKFPAYQKPYVNGYATYDSLLGKLYITVVNNNATEDISTNININGFTPDSIAKIKTLNENDGWGMLSINGFATGLSGPVDKGAQQIPVVDSSRFKADDIIAIQSPSQGWSEFFKIRAIDGTTIHLMGLDNSPKGVGYYYFEPGQPWRNPGCWYTNVDVVKVSPSVYIFPETEITNVNQNFSYTFPAHSVTVLELSQSSADTAPPTISDITVSDITQTSSKITWTTDESATTKVEYGADANYGFVIYDAPLAASHSIGLSNLSANTTYHYRVVSKDASNNEAQSQDYTFTTLAASQPPDGGGGGGGGGGGVIEKPIAQMSIAELLAKISQLKALIAGLQAQISQAQGLPVQGLSEIPANYKFVKPLYLGLKSIDVRYLQIFLKSQGSEIYPKGLITGYFGLLTKAAVINFQVKHKIIPSAYSLGAGLVGTKTRAKINEILHR